MSVEFQELRDAVPQGVDGLDKLGAEQDYWHQCLELGWLMVAAPEELGGLPAAKFCDAVLAEAERLTGRRPKGPIRMLTHLRYLGFAMNPVSFYYCFHHL